MTERALVEYQQAAQLDPDQPVRQSAPRARAAELPGAAPEPRHRHRSTSSRRKRSSERPQPPVLNPRSTQPISLEFPEPVSIFQIYRALGKAFGINILFDPNLKDQEIAIELKDVTAQNALETLMRAVNHFYKVLDDHTILIAADTPQNRRTYEDLVIQTFFLSNAEVKDMMTILRSLVDAKKIATNEQLNAIILRDTADRVKVAEKIIETNDKAKAEVVVDVELLQINTRTLRDLGVEPVASTRSRQTLDRWADKTRCASRTPPVPEPGRLDPDPAQASSTTSSRPTPTRSCSPSRSCASPRARRRSSSSATGCRSRSPPSTPRTRRQQHRAHHLVPVPGRRHQDRDRAARAPQPGGDAARQGRGEQPQRLRRRVGTARRSRSSARARIDSVIRLQDGETNFLAGLIRTDESTRDSGVPGLSDIPHPRPPVLDEAHRRQRTDVILTLTPHIIRNADITEEDLKPIWVGTERTSPSAAAARGSSRTSKGRSTPTRGRREEIQDAIRRRLQRLPRGLQPGQRQRDGWRRSTGATQGQPRQPSSRQPPGGVNLVPSAPPTDIFRAAAPADPAAAGTSRRCRRKKRSRRRRRRSSHAPAPRRRSEMVNPRALLGTSAPSGRREAGRRRKRGAAAAVRLWLHARTARRVAAGEQLDRGGRGEAERGVSHLPLTLTYDPAVLAFDSAAAGDFLGGSRDGAGDGGRLPPRHPGARRQPARRGPGGQRPGDGGARHLPRSRGRGCDARIDSRQPKALDGALRPVLPLRTRRRARCVTIVDRQHPGEAPRREAAAL